MRSCLPLARARASWLRAAVTPCCAATRSGRECEAKTFKSVRVAVHRLIVEIAGDVVIVGNGFETEELAKAGERLNASELGGGDVGLKLQELQLDFQEVAFAHVAGVKADVADVHGFLEAVEILLGEIERGFGEKHVDELLGDVEGQLALGIGHLRANDGGGVLRGVQTVLAFFAAFERDS